MIHDMSIPESFLCQFLDLSQSLIFLHLGLIQNSLFWFSWDWSQNHFFDSSWTYPYVLVLLVLGLIPESNFKEFWVCPKVIKNTNWEQCQIPPAQDIKTDPKTLFSSHLDQSQIHPVYDFGTDPNVPFFYH